jgi:transcriptional accessory protein Tex/SPT6
MLQAMERELINSVNNCGVNLNAAVLNPHRQAMLAFVSGLGYVKAHDLLGKVKKMRHSQVSKRAALKPLLGAKVFANAAGFLRIRDFPLAHLNPIDDTRIHPETYSEHNWVRTIISESCGEDDDARRLLDKIGEEGEWGELAQLCIDKHRDAITIASQEKVYIYICV